MRAGSPCACDTAWAIARPTTIVATIAMNVRSFVDAASICRSPPLVVGGERPIGPKSLGHDVQTGRQRPALASRALHSAVPGGVPTGCLRENPVPTQLRLGSADRECAPQIAREPEVQHLAALSEPSPLRARAVVARLQTAVSAGCADEVRVPARDRAPGGGSQFAALHAEHHAYDNERAATRHVRVDQRLRVAGVEQLGGAAIASLRVEVADRATVTAHGRACDVSGCRGGAERRPTADGASTRLDERLRGAALVSSRQSRDRVLLEMIDEAASRVRGQQITARTERAEESRSRGSAARLRPVCACEPISGRTGCRRQPEAHERQRGEEFSASHGRTVRFHANERVTAADLGSTAAGESLRHRFCTSLATSGSLIPPASENAPAAKTFAPARVS